MKGDTCMATLMVEAGVCKPGSLYKYCTPHFERVRFFERKTQSVRRVRDGGHP
jgi:hypothetical protein